MPPGFYAELHLLTMSSESHYTQFLPSTGHGLQESLLSSRSSEVACSAVVVEAEHGGRESGLEVLPYRPAGRPSVPDRGTVRDTPPSALPSASTDITINSGQVVSDDSGVGRRSLRLLYLNIQNLRKACERYSEELDQLISCHDVCVFVETHLRKNEPVKEIRNYAAVHKVRSKYGGGGITVLVRKPNVLKVVEEFTDNDDLLCVQVQLNGISQKLKIIAVYIPPANSCTRPDSKAFFDLMASTLSKVQTDERALICGDFNARIYGSTPLLETQTDDELCGKAEYVKLRNVDNRLSRATGRGSELIDFCSSSCLTPLNGLQSFGKNFSSRFTCTEYGGSSVVDYVLVPQKEISMYSRFEISSDAVFSDHHELSWVMSFSSQAESASRRQVIRNRTAPSVDVAHLCSNTMNSVSFPSHLITGAAALHWVENVAQIARVNLRAATSRVTAASLPKDEKEIKTLKLMRTHAWKELNSNQVPENRKHLQNQFWIAQKAFRSAVKNENYKKSRAVWLELELLKKANASEYWKRLTGEDREHDSCAVQGITTSGLVSYFRGFSERGPSERLFQYPLTSPSIPVLDGAITNAEAYAAVRKLSGASSSGGYTVDTKTFKELLRHGQFLGVFVAALNHIYDTADFPPGWLDGTMTPVPKKGKEYCAENCRPIVVELLPMRILSTVIAKRVELWAALEDDQGGFRSGRATSDQIFLLHTVCESRLRKGCITYLAFLDYTSAFDTVNHEKLFRKLGDCGASVKLLKFLEKMYMNGRNRIKWQGDYSEYYELLNGVRQGDPLSAILFLLYIDRLSSAVRHNRRTPIFVGTAELFCLKYADDVVLVSPDPGHLQESIDRVVAFSRDNDLMLNVKKSFVMAVKGRKRGEITFTSEIDGTPLEQVAEFKYLGLFFNERLCLKKSAKHVLRSCEKAHYGFKQKLQNIPPGYPLKTAVTFFESFVGSACLQQSELLGALPETDKYQLRLLSEFFNLNRSVPRDGLYYLGAVFPWHFRRIRLQLNFLKKIFESPPESLIRLALKEAILTAKHRKTAWLRTVLKPFSALIPINWSLETDDVLTFLKNLNAPNVVAQLEKQFRDALLCRVQDNAARCGKLGFMFQVFPEPKRPSFFACLPQHMGSYLMKLLLSNHHFRIETGRWEDLPSEARICQSCTTIENENHCLFSCPAYHLAREELYLHLASLLPLNPSSNDLFNVFCFVLRARQPFDERQVTHLFSIAKFVRSVVKDAYSVYCGKLCLLPQEDFFVSLEDIGDLASLD